MCLINCGRGGIGGPSNQRFSDYLVSAGLPDIVVFTETHLLPASAPALEHYNIIWKPRTPAHLRANVRGGVAFAISNSTTCVQSAQWEHDCRCADVAWIRVTLAASTTPLYIAAVYLPPHSHERVCNGDSDGCVRLSCSKAHVSEALYQLSVDTRRYSAQGFVIITGDFNVRAQDPLYRRWVEVHDAVIANNELTVVNPRDGAGNLLPTWRKGEQSSVLDLMMWSERPSCSVVCDIDATATVSDHIPLLATLELVDVTKLSAQQQLTPHPQYGLQSSIPSHLRGSHQVVKPLPRSGLIAFAADIKDRFATDIPPQCTVSDIEKWLMVKSELHGLVQKRERPPPAIKASSLIQRRIDSVKIKLHRLSTLPDSPQSLIRSLRAQVVQLTAQRLSVLPSRRVAQRESRRKHRQQQRQQNDNLDGPWRATDPFTFAHRANKHQRGHLSHRTNRIHTPLIELQCRLASHERDLREKYSQDGDESRVQRWHAQLKEDVECGRDVDSGYVPSAEQIQVAMSRLKSGSDAIGLPVAVLKQTVGTPAFDSIVSGIQRMWRTGEIPDSFTLSRVHLIYKSGPPELLSSHRTIGICSAMSRLFQVTVEAKLMEEVGRRISPAQYGFMRNKATELCVFVAEAVTFAARCDGATVDTGFVDIKGAFPTTRHDLIHAALRNYNVSVAVRRLIINWYAKQRLFLQLGRLISDIVGQWLGVTEGNVFSPIIFVIVVDPAIHRLHSLYLIANFDIGIPVLMKLLILLFYADDGRTFGLTQRAKQFLWSHLGREFAELFFLFNFAINKTAVMRSLPIPKQQRARARTQPPPQYTLSNTPIPQTAVYKHLGVQCHQAGPNKSRAVHNGKLASVLASIEHRAASSSMQSLPLIHCRSIYLTYWWPQVMYAAGLIQTSVPQSFATTESHVLRYLMSGYQHPTVCLRSVLGMPSQQTRIDLDRLRLLFRLFRQSRSGFERCALAVTVAQYDQHRNMQSWWHRTNELLTTMDTICLSPVVRARITDCPVSWVQTCRHFALHFDDIMDVKQLSTLYDAARAVMLEVEAFRRRSELTACQSSLEEVWDLLDTPNIAPFTCLKRGRRTSMRVGLWGGRRTLFGYRNFHVAVCPWCYEPNQFTIRHVFRDCPVLENDRRIVFTEAAAFLQRHGVKSVCNIDGEDREHWYRLMVGASVDNKKISLQLNKDTHFARPPTQPATRHLREHLTVYRGVIAVLDGFFQAVVLTTTLRLEWLVEVVLQSPSRGVRAPRVNHRNVPVAELMAAEFEDATAMQPQAAPLPAHPVIAASVNQEPVFDPLAPWMTAPLPGFDNYTNWYDGDGVTD